MELLQKVDIYHDIVLNKRSGPELAKKKQEVGVMRKILAAAIVVLLGANAFALKGITFDQNGSIGKIITNIQETIPDSLAVPAARVEKKGKKQWTVMVFVNAKNNLERYGLKDTNEMEMVGSSDKVNVVVELGRISGYYSGEGDWKTTRRYLIKKDNNPSLVTSPVLMEMEKTDMGDWKHLVDFAKWSMEKFPAEHYMLVIWNHGSGWNKDETFAATKGISYDSETHNHITTAQLKMAAKEIGGLDILSMDACLMQMMEVAYEVKEHVKYVVASEETEPGDGYTYNTFLAPLIEQPYMTPAQLGKVTVNAFVDHYASIGYSATHSSIKASSLLALKDMLNEWVKTVMEANDREVVKSARSAAQDFYYSSNKDLYHFLKLVSEKSQNEEVIARSKEVMRFMEKETLSYNKTTGSGYKNAYGLAIYLPYYLSSAYSDLEWAKDSQWDEFIKWYK